MSVTKDALSKAEEQPKWIVYILLCDDNSFYVGSTSNLKRRLRQHRDGSLRGYTKARRPVRLVYKKPYPTQQLAENRERQIKGWSRRKKINLIKYGAPKGLPR